MTKKISAILTEDEQKFIRENIYNCTTQEISYKLNLNSKIIQEYITENDLGTFVKRGNKNVRNINDTLPNSRTKQRLDYILKNTDKTYKEIADELKMNVNNVRSLCNNYGIEVRKIIKKLNDNDITYIKENVDKFYIEEIAETLGFSINTIYNYLWELQLNNVIDKESFNNCIKNMYVINSEINSKTYSDKKNNKTNKANKTIGIDDIIGIVGIDKIDNIDSIINIANIDDIDYKYEQIKNFFRNGYSGIKFIDLVDIFNVSKTKLISLRTEQRLEDGKIVISDENKEYIKNNSLRTDTYTIARALGLAEDIVSSYCKLNNIYYSRTIKRKIKSETMETLKDNI